MYQQSGAQGQPGAGAGFNGGAQGGPQNGGSQSNTGSSSDNVQDADFEEVK